MSGDLDSLLEIESSPGVSTGVPTFGTEGTVSTGQSIFASSVMTRYRDAYLVARVTTGFGSVIKGIGVLIAVVIFGGASMASNQVYGDAKAMYTTAGFILAVFTGAVFYLFGVLVSAQGQILKASLDGAVNGSPFLSNPQKAEVMSLQ